MTRSEGQEFDFNALGASGQRSAGDDQPPNSDPSSSGVGARVQMPDWDGEGRRSPNIPIACIACRKRKSKCSGARPSCKNCKRAGRECVYPPDTRPYWDRNRGVLEFRNLLLALPAREALEGLRLSEYETNGHAIIRDFTKWVNIHRAKKRAMRELMEKPMENTAQQSAQQTVQQPAQQPAQQPRREVMRETMQEVMPGSTLQQLPLADLSAPLQDVYGLNLPDPFGWQQPSMDFNGGFDGVYMTDDSQIVPQQSQFVAQQNTPKTPIPVYTSFPFQATRTIVPGWN